MIYQNGEDLPAFLLTALAQGNRSVFGESILEGYILKPFRNNVVFLLHNQEMDDKLIFFGENTVIFPFFTCEEVWLTMHQEQTGRYNKIVFHISLLLVS